jgi:hypothetical protein
VGRLPWITRGVAKCAAHKLGLDVRLDAIATAYKTISMDESLPPLPTPLDQHGADLAADYISGVTVLSPNGSPLPLDPYAHDFVIPSVSQAIGPRRSPNGEHGTRPPDPYFLGNLINPRSSHLSGGEKDSDRNDVSLTVQLLDSMGREL